MIVREKEVGVFNVDWLSYSVRLKCDPDEIELECLPELDIQVCKGTNQYSNRVIVSDGNGTKIITLLWKPIQKIIDCRLMLVEVGNSYLYHDSIYTSWLVLNALVPCEFNNMSRVDLCCDFMPTAHEKVVIRQLARKRYYVANKHDGSEFWKNSGETNQLNWGSPRSQFKWKLYNKSMELRCDKGGDDYDKPYIVSEWIDAGFDIRFVWRLEISMVDCSKFLLLNRKLGIDDMFSATVPIALFLDEKDRRFVIRIEQGHSRKSNDKVVKFLEFYQPRIKLEIRSCGEKNIYAGSAEFFNLKRQLETSRTIVLNEKLARNYYNLARQVAVDYKLDNHFGKVYGKTSTEMLDEALARSGFYWEHGLN